MGGKGEEKKREEGKKKREKGKTQIRPFEIGQLSLYQKGNLRSPENKF